MEEPRPHQVAIQTNTVLLLKVNHHMDNNHHTGNNPNTGSSQHMDKLLPPAIRRKTNTVLHHQEITPLSMVVPLLKANLRMANNQPMVKHPLKVTASLLPPTALRLQATHHSSNTALRQHPTASQPMALLLKPTAPLTPHPSATHQHHRRSPGMAPMTPKPSAKP